LTIAPIICGDGNVAGAEACDDGNVDPNDGCSDLCAVEVGFFCDAAEPTVCTDLAPICAAATDANLGANTGDTTGGTEFFVGQNCGFFGGGNGAEQIFSIIPGAAGQTGVLSLTLNSATDQGLHVNTDCLDANSEIGCVDDNVGGTDETLDVNVTDAGAALTIFVDAFAVGEEGPFTLTLAFAADTCGDGLVTGGEGCDDNNIAANDGCSDLCQVEAGFACVGEPSVCTDLSAVCAAALAANAGANAGDTTGGTEFFSVADDGAGCTFGAGGGAEVLFTFTPATDGPLSLTLASATDQGVYVLTDCVDTGSIIGCQDLQIGGTDEVLNIANAIGGVPLTIIVDAFAAGDEGPFTLTIQ
jgi:cysteine-rich repeat protein